MQDADNIYAPPQAALERDDGTASGALYSARSVVLATFLGSLLAGGVLLAVNYRRLGRPGAALRAIIGALFGEAALLALALALPADLHIPNIAFTVAQMFLMSYLAKLLQGEALRTHVASGGPVASGWAAAGIGLLFGGALLGGLLFAASRLQL